MPWTGLASHDKLRFANCTAIALAVHGRAAKSLQPFAAFLPDRICGGYAKIDASAPERTCHCATIAQVVTVSGRTLYDTVTWVQSGGRCGEIRSGVDRCIRL